MLCAALIPNPWMETGTEQGLTATTGKLLLDHTKLIPCSTEHQGNEVGSVGRKEN